MFAAESVWNWEAERNYRVERERNPQVVQAARGLDGGVELGEL